MRLRRAIREGRLRPGEALSISDLAADLGIRRSPVREALQRLSGQGLAVLRLARTVIVAPLELGELQEIYRLRGLIEPTRWPARLLLSPDAILKRSRRNSSASWSPRMTPTSWDSHNSFHLGLLVPR